MRGLGEPDTFPATEIDLRRVLARGAAPFSADALECFAETWRPWRAYAAMYLWSAHNCRREDGINKESARTQVRQKKRKTAPPALRPDAPKKPGERDPQWGGAVAPPPSVGMERR